MQHSCQRQTCVLTTMPRARRICSTCPTPVLAGQQRCDECKAKAERDRGTATQRGYTSRGHRAFRRAVLAKQPICVSCRRNISTVADHWPISRKDLIDQGLDPNDPARGRGLCKPCHDTETATNQPGGWNVKFR